MARKNQQDIRCFEADTFRQELIDDLKINSSRVKFSLQKKKNKAEGGWAGVNPMALFEDKLV